MEKGYVNRMCQELIKNLHQLHTTELGAVRLRRNLRLDTVDVVEWCRKQIENAEQIECRGKNWYVSAGGAVITVNAGSFTVITAHAVK